MSLVSPPEIPPVYTSYAVQAYSAVGGAGPVWRDVVSGEYDTDTEALQLAVTLALAHVGTPYRTVKRTMTTNPVVLDETIEDGSIWVLQAKTPGVSDWFVTPASAGGMSLGDAEVLCRASVAAATAANLTTVFRKAKLVPTS